MTHGLPGSTAMLETALIKERIKYCQALEASLANIKIQLRDIPEVEKAILFGSYAAGRRDLFTDIDLLIVMNTPLGYLERTAMLYQRLQTTVDLDLIVYTPDEFAKKRDSGFLRQVLHTGQVIYEK
jgi:uncharacterized protein